MIFFSNNLKLLREKSGFRQSDLASKIGLKPNTVSIFEKGVSQPDYEILYLITELFDVTADDILFKDLTTDSATSRNLIQPDTSKEKEPENDRFVVERLFEALNSKDKKIEELQKTVTTQAKDIGRLEGELNQLKRTTPPLS
ncbi:MAG: helix-turn-helix domain-containing protein [Tannerellaceae bacterium]|nr:helix-turn-helix domain-containing protein [Tannerellaceae bacterium]